MDSPESIDTETRFWHAVDDLMKRYKAAVAPENYSLADMLAHVARTIARKHPQLAHAMCAYYTLGKPPDLHKRILIPHLSVKIPQDSTGATPHFEWCPITDEKIRYLVIHIRRALQ